MAIKVGKVGTGTYKHTFISGILTIPIATTGLLFSLTPPAGQRVRIETIQAANSLTSVGYITIKVGLNTVVANLYLYNGQSTGYFSIGSPSTQNGGNPSAIPNITGGIDEAIIVTSNSATVGTLFYNYSFGE